MKTISDGMSQPSGQTWIWTNGPAFCSYFSLRLYQTFHHPSGRRVISDITTKILPNHFLQRVRQQPYVRSSRSKSIQVCDFLFMRAQRRSLVSDDKYILTARHFCLVEFLIMSLFLHCHQKVGRITGDIRRLSGNYWKTRHEPRAINHDQCFTSGGLGEMTCFYSEKTCKYSENIGA